MSIDWNIWAPVLVEVIFGTPFVFVVLFSKLMRMPAAEAWGNFKAVIAGRMSFRTLKFKPGHIPPANTQGPTYEWKME